MKSSINILLYISIFTFALAALGSSMYYSDTEDPTSYFASIVLLFIAIILYLVLIIKHIYHEK